jgi:hypothetical protein
LGVLVGGEVGVGVFVGVGEGVYVEVGEGVNVVVEVKVGVMVDVGEEVMVAVGVPVPRKLKNDGSGTTQADTRMRIKIKGRIPPTHRVFTGWLNGARISLLRGALINADSPFWELYQINGLQN